MKSISRRTFLASASAACLAHLLILPAPHRRVFPRRQLSRVHEIGRNTAGGPAELRAALEAEFGPGELTFKDEVATVIVDVSGIAPFLPSDHPNVRVMQSDHPDVRVIPMRIVEPASRRMIDWHPVLSCGPDWRRNHLALS